MNKKKLYHINEGSVRKGGKNPPPTTPRPPAPQAQKVSRGHVKKSARG